MTSKSHGSACPIRDASVAPHVTQYVAEASVHAPHHAQHHEPPHVHLQPQKHSSSCNDGLGARTAVLDGRVIEDTDSALIADLNRHQVGASWSLGTPYDPQRPVWTSRASWLLQTACVLDTARGQQACRDEKVAPAKVLATATAMAEVAEGATGGRVCKANERLAADAGIPTTTFRRARCVLRTLELAYEVARGRTLRAVEMRAARTHHGNYQPRAASTWALSSPAYAVALHAQTRPSKQTRSRRRGRGHLSPKSPVREISPVGKNSPTRNREQRKRIDDNQDQPRPLHAHRAAAKIAAQLGDLRMGYTVHRPLVATKRRHIGALVAALSRAGVDTERWDGGAIVARINADTAARGWTPPARISNPIGWIYHRLTQFDWTVPSPREQALAARARLQAEAAARRAELESSRRAAAAVDSPARLHAVRNWRSYKHLSDTEITQLTA